MTGRNKFNKFKKLIKLLIRLFSILGTSGNKILYTWSINLSGNLGILIRYVLISNISTVIGDNVSIHKGVYLFHMDKLFIGSNVSIHPMCYIDAAGIIEIGDNVSIAHSSTLISSNHTWQISTIPIKYNPEKFDKIIIDSDVWIGCGVRILAGVHVQKRVVIAAGSIVNKNVESNCVIAGVPAKKVKSI